MSKTNPVTVGVLDKEYTVACNEEEKAALLDAAEFLNKKIKEVRSSGKVAGNEKVVVMAALNIVHELLSYRDSGNVSEEFEDFFHRVQDKISVALETQAD